MEPVSNVVSFGGEQRRYQHHSAVLGCDMHFSLYLPSQAKSGTVPLLYWLSGLTCTDENFVTKAGAQGYAAEHGIAIVAPDTSPRGDDVPDDPEGAWDFGLAAGFYVDASEPPFDTHYKMYSYITEELPALLTENVPELSGKTAISGHSMGGHGALTIALKNPGRFSSVSAFAPICAPASCPWGHKAFGGYLGDDRSKWEAHDASILIQSAPERLPMLIDQGSADGFLEEQLMPEKLTEAAAAAGYPVQYELREGYDHSYFYIASFIGEHIAFHAKHLG